MSEFKTIQTQEEFDAAIKDRLERERAKYADYDSLKQQAGELAALKKQDLQGQLSRTQAQLKEANDKLAGHEKTVADLTARAVTAEAAQLKARVAHQYHIPYEMADRLAGTTEEELKKDAETLAKFVTHTESAPLFSPEKRTGGGDDKTSMYQELLHELKGE